MVTFLLLALQAATPPDIELRANVRARTLIIENAGRASVTVTAGGQNVVSIEGPKANGRKRINNPVYEVNIEARVADPQVAPQPEAPRPD